MPIRLIILGIILLVIGFLLDVWSETAHLDISGNFLADVITAATIFGFGAVFLGVGWLVTTSRSR
jgi:hypothetical protein